MLLPERERKLCPNIEDPLDSCYCNEMSSQDVENAIYYCANNYESCEIYIDSCSELLTNTAETVLPRDDITESPS